MDIDRTHILKELKELKKFVSDAEFARYIGITPQNLSNWYKRNTYDEYLIANKFTDVNIDWLLTGKGARLKTDAEPIKPQATADSVSMPRDVWEVIRNQAASLKTKDEQVDKLIDILRKKGEGVGAINPVARQAAGE